MKPGRFWLQVTGMGVAVAALLVALGLLRHEFLLGHFSLEIYLLLVGAPLLAGGVVAGRWLAERRRGVTPVTVNPPDSPLTDRELQILDHVSSGLSNQEIADELFVTVATVKTHLQSIYGKLDVRRRTQAVDRARRLGLIT